MIRAGAPIRKTKGVAAAIRVAQIGARPLLHWAGSRVRTRGRSHARSFAREVVRTRGRSHARPKACAPGLAVLRAAPCVSRPTPLNPAHRSRRYAVRRNFQQHHRPAWIPRGRNAVGREPRLDPDPVTEGAFIVKRRTEGPPGPFCAALFRRRHRRPAQPVRFLRREKRRLTRKYGAAYTAPPDAVRKKNGAGRTDFLRFRKVDLAKAEVLDFPSASSYESDY